MQAGRVVVVEPLLNHRVGKDVESSQGGEEGCIGDQVAPLEDRSEAYLDFTFNLWRQHGGAGESGFFELLVKPCREEKKLRVLEGEPLSPFGDAPLAENHTLPTTAECLADDGPFFECHVHKIEFLLYTCSVNKGNPTSMTHRFDLHTHSFFSKDACSTPEELVAAARKRGLSGIAITDHDSCDVHAYLRRFRVPDGFLILPGVEVSTAEGHLLCIGATLPRMKGVPAREVLEEIKKAGGVAIPAHPFDQWRAGIRAAVLDTLDIEVLEVFNAAVTCRGYNDKALEYARKRGLGMTASSDAHHDSAVGVASTGFELDTLSVPAVLEALRRGGRPEGTCLTFREGLKKHFGNWFRFANRRPPVFS